jgi:poly(hydroxyalkanoate) depolymerase family esterase
MVSRAIAHFGSDRGRVFIAGLSAGGAMAASVLAAHPELFSAGAVVAGLPVGTAGNAMAALGRMATGGPDRHPDAWAASVRSTRPKDHAGTWPRLSVWHGASDDIVVPANGEQLAKEWAALHRLPEAPPDAGGVHRRWGEAVEFWRLPGLAHGWPVAAGGNAGKFTFDNPVPAVPMIARFWGL